MAKISAIANHLAARFGLPEVTMQRRVSALAQAGLILSADDVATARDAAALLVVGLASISPSDSVDVLLSYSEAPATSSAQRHKAVVMFSEVVLPVIPGEPQRRYARQKDWE